LATGCNRLETQYIFEKGLREEKAENWTAAAADFSEVIKREPGNGPAYVDRAIGATEDCKKAVKLFQPEATGDLYDQGMLDFISGDYEKAIADWQKVIQQDAAIKTELQPWIDKAQSKLQEKNP
jgi:outer membrane protein assembly factor BamD (BamD/ComL family)